MKPIQKKRLKETIVDLTKSRYQTSWVLARAFATNPAYLFMVPPHKNRQNRFLWLMKRVLSVSLQIGLCETTDSGSGVALWLPPGKHLKYSNLIRAGLLLLPFRLGFVSFIRIIWVLSQNKVFAKKITLKKPYYYLFHLAVDPEVQGRGLGTALIHSMTSRADRENVSCFLETDKKENIRLYERHGFSVQAELQVDFNLTIWYMLRPPLVPTDG